MVETTSRRPVGTGRILVAGYAVFVLAAGGRSAVQLATQAGRAPVAYALSAVAAACYLVSLCLLSRVERGTAASRRAAAAWCGLEIAGVTAVGSASVLDSGAFPDATVWSHFGAGYGFVPLLLPVVAAIWLHRRGAGAA